MILKLRGYLSRIDTQQGHPKLIFEHAEDAHEKLLKHVLGEHVPYTDREFRVGFGSGQVPDDILRLVSRSVICWVKPAPYSFVSRAKHNKGERISGVRLLFVDIEPVVKI